MMAPRPSFTVPSSFADFQGLLDLSQESLIGAIKQSANSREFQWFFKNSYKT